jgi:hypothetical protein
MQAFRMLTSLGLAWIGLLCVALSAPAKADPIKADPIEVDLIRIAAPGTSNAAGDRWDSQGFANEGLANQGSANARAAMPWTKGSDVGLGNAGVGGDIRAGILSQLDRAMLSGTRFVRFDFGAGNDTGSAAAGQAGANGAQIPQRFRTGDARAIRLGYSNGTGSKQSNPWS